jgi:hypothetical protein
MLSLIARSAEGHAESWAARALTAFLYMPSRLLRRFILWPRPNEKRGTNESQRPDHLA